jgi:excisionase family DNA binding protein
MSDRTHSLGLGSGWSRQESAAPRVSLRLHEAAKALGISPSTLERLTRAGEIPARKANRCTLYSVAVLQAWAEGRPVGGSHDAV